jgi:type IV secretory pathway VirB6-like protein
MKIYAGFFSLMLVLAVMTLSFAVADNASAQLVNPGDNTGAGCNADLTVAGSTKCNACVNDTTAFSQFSSQNLGQGMVAQMFAIINQILQTIEATYYNGIVNNTDFQEIIGASFILYVGFYGMMIMFNLASYRGGEITDRLIKVVIVYAMCSTNGWTFFNTWIQTPVIGGINELITNMANAGSAGGSNECITQGQFSGNSLNGSGAGVGYTINLATGPMAMLWGPMSCVFGATFLAGIQALLLTGFYGWLLAGLLLYAMVQFVFMILGAIVTYVKAIVGLTFLFALTPFFFAFYLFEKTRSLTKAWLNKVIAFALQPVMLFAFLAFYAGIVGATINTIFTDSAGNKENICYVPFFEMPNMFQMYAYKFSNQYHAAGGSWVSAATGSSAMGDPLPSPAQILSILYFLVLCTLGKQFSGFITDFSDTLAGGRGAGAVTGDDVQHWLNRAGAANRGGGGSSGSIFGGSSNSSGGGAFGGLGRMFNGLTGSGDSSGAALSTRRRPPGSS